MKLIDCRSSRDNNLNIMRLVAAFFVLFGHSFTLLWTTPENPHGRPYQRGIAAN